MKTICIGWLMALFMVAGASAQSPARLSAIVARAREKFNLPALAVGTMNAREITAMEVQGVININDDRPTSGSNLFHIGSCSKSVLAIIAARLIEDGKLQWNTKFFDIFPELRSKALPEYNEITLQDLFLCHAGIRPFTSLAEEFPPPDPTATNPAYHFVAWLVQQTPAAPREGSRFAFAYSNAGYALASLMLERVDGRTYDQMIDHYVVEGMQVETVIGFPNHIDPSQPWGHLITSEGIQVFGPEHSYRLPPLLVPAGNLSMTPGAFARYAQNHLRGLLGVDSFVSSRSYHHIHYAEKGFAVGMYNTRAYGIPFTGMDGSAGTFFCRAVFIPQHDLAIIVMTNAGSGTAEMPAVNWITRKVVKSALGFWWKFWM